MVNFMASRKIGARLISLLLALAMLLSMAPAALAEEAIGKVTVIVENTTFTSAVNGVAPAWTGELINTEVDIYSNSTMMSCVKAALVASDVSCTGADSNYISEIGGLSASQGGSMSGWMGTLNDWFVSEAFTNFTVADGDLIRVSYSKDGGPDLGGDWSNNDKRLKSVSFSAGTLNAEFSGDTHEYTLDIPADCEGVVVTPTAANKNYQVRTYVGETEYKRTATIPVEVGTVITVKCGDPSWPSMSDKTGAAQVYTFTVTDPSRHTPITAYVSVSNGGAILKDKNNADAVRMKVELDNQLTYTVDDILSAAHVLYHADGANAYVTSDSDFGTMISKVWGVETDNCGYYVSGAMATGLTDSVKMGDHIEVAIFANAYPNTEAYAAFDKSVVEANAATEFELTLKSASFDENFNMVMNPCAGATILVDGVETEIVTDEAGKASISIESVGKHVVSAVKTKTVNDETVPAITAPICEVTIRNVLESGAYGNVNWKVYDTGVLELSAVEGTDGKMSGRINKYTLPTWTKKYNDTINSIVVQEGVTTILDYAFYTMSNVKSVSFPSTLTSIGNDTFSGVKTITDFTCAEGCAYKVSGNFLLKNNGTEIFMVINPGKLTGVVTVPAGVTKIGTTFQATNITGIIFPDSVETIEGYTTKYDSAAGVMGGPFAYCAKLESITIPCNLGSKETFVGCTSLKEVTFKAAVTELSANPFKGCTALATFKFEEGSAFSEKNGFLLKNDAENSKSELLFATSAVATGAVTIPEGVTDIGEFVFSENEDITSVSFPTTLKTIGQYAFAQCKGLSGTLELNEGLEEIDVEAFGNCSNITAVKLPASLKSVGKYGFYKTGLTSIEGLRADISFGYYNFAYTQVTSINLPDGLVIPTNFFQNCTALEEVSVGSDVSKKAFANCTALKTVTVREGVTKVGESAFSGCTALTTVNMPSSLTGLDGTAFSGCTLLKSVNFAEGCVYSCRDGIIYKDTAILIVLGSLSGDITIADGVTEIGANAFEEMTGITSVTLPDSVEKIGRSAFSGCTGLKTINLPEKITVINPSTFSNCSSLKSINLPSKLEEIGTQAFYQCTALETAPVFPTSLKKIASSAYYRCTGMKGTVRIPGNVTYLGGSMFAYCSGITGAYIEDCVASEYEEFGTQIFGYCTGLTEVRLPETMTDFSSIIYNCSSLRRLVIPKSVTSLSWQFLPNNFVYLDLGGVTEVEDTTIQNMKVLKELVLSENLTSYQDSARSCKPDVIYFRGTQEQWNAVSFNENTLANLEANGTMIVFNYGSETGDTPTITKQPVGGEYRMGAEVKLSIEVDEKEGAQYIYHWYCDGEMVANGKECEISTGVAGEHEYYCMVRCSMNGKYSEVKSDVVTVTIIDVQFTGEGTKESPYLLSTTDDLKLLSLKVNGGNSYKDQYFKMTKNIELPANWKPIGATKDGQNGISKGANLNAFSGTFDGNGKRVIVPKGERPLFAYVNGATICHLEIYGEQIEGYGLVDCFTGVGLSGTAMILDDITLISGTKTLYSGLIGARKFENPNAGCSSGYVATIKNCTIQSGVVIGYTGDQSEIGGFAGRMQGTVENCVNHGTVKGKNYVGGIIATRDNSMGTCKVLNCTFDGTVEGTNNIGGIVGGGYSITSAPNGGKVTCIGNTSGGTVKGTSYVGGILGGDMVVAQSWNNTASSFKNNTFNGTIRGTEYVGAIIGYYKSLNKYDDVSGNKYSADCGVGPVGCVWVIDTNYENPTAANETTYVNTEFNTSSCPAVSGCSWSVGHNRTDDPLGANIAELFSVIGAPQYTLGDLDNNGKINTDDVLMANDAVLVIVQLTETQKLAADVNRDGKINTDDVLMINDYVLRIITEFEKAA